VTATLQIVDGHGGALVLELNDTLGGVGGLVRRGMDLAEGQLAGGGPETDWSPLAGPSALGRRRITIPFLLIGADADALGAKVAKLMSATQGPWWLRVRRHEASADSWLQCFGCVPQVDSQITSSRAPHMVQGTISCETAPHALGNRVDGSAAIGQNPASSAAWAINIDGVTGDTATPLLLRLNDPSVFGLGAFGAFFSIRRRQTPADLTGPLLTRQAESGSNSMSSSGAGLTLATFTGDAAFSGSSGVRATFSSGYAALTPAQINFAAPGLTGPSVPGVYRMFARIRRNTPALASQLVLKPFTNAALITPEDITVPAGGPAIRVVDLGLIQWPAAAPASIAAPVPSPSGATTTRVTLQFWRKIDGAGLVDFDFLCFVPADDDAGYLSVDKALANPDTEHVVIDGYQNLAMITSGDPLAPHNILGQPFGSTGTPTVDWTGGVARVRPGTNRLFMVAGIGGESYPIALNTTIKYSYWPRYTWLR
jgi:hypothetical protein